MQSILEFLSTLVVGFQIMQARQYLLISAIKGIFPDEDRVGLGNDLLEVIRNKRFLERTAPPKKRLA